MATRLPSSTARRLAHQLRPYNAWSRVATANLHPLLIRSHSLLHNGKCITPLPERCSATAQQQRTQLNSNKILHVEARSTLQDNTKRSKQQTQTDDTVTHQSSGKLTAHVQKQKKMLQRALARFKSRLALFKIYTRYRERRKVIGSLATLKKYMLEKKLKFGATAKNQERLKKIRELRDKIAKKSTAFRLGATFAIKKYGKLGAGIYLGVYIATLIFMNLLTFNGYLSADGLRKTLEKVHMNHFEIPDIDSGFARFTVAYLATKALEPLRFVVSLLLIMGVNRALKR